MSQDIEKCLPPRAAIRAMEQPHKEHRARQAGSSARKKKGKSDKNKQDNKQNPKVLNCFRLLLMVDDSKVILF